eukprot:CAMPEP_0204401884 /NCGR_PEP_ID=MMETSP0470-20130426/4957_1 /ASSEMBLY_ACC=CAM_ASM_000385 /TAXON_ID=2969 /ORGANISM="Oxyrrhis marina" /LENGTH=53 /DNA_ID=CAMNT_0051396903 /DNA_START=16 /DNA_END=174 /DNA_ORIENTATION=+
MMLLWRMPLCCPSLLSVLVHGRTFLVIHAALPVAGGPSAWAAVGLTGSGWGSL